MSCVIHSRRHCCRGRVPCQSGAPAGRIAELQARSAYLRVATRRSTPPRPVAPTTPDHVLWAYLRDCPGRHGVAPPHPLSAPERNATTMAGWRVAHPGVTVICRDEIRGRPVKVE